MEKAMYPSPYIRITQKHGIGSHVDSYAFDEAGSDGGIDYLIASFTGTIKKIYTSDANEVWFESVDKVQYPDGTIDYMTLMLAHDNDVSNLKVGQVIKQGQRFYEEGTKGQATGNHCHIECARGKFTGTGWHQNSAGYWSINNGKKVDECLWIDDSYHILNTAGYKFKNVKDAEPKKYGTPVARNEYVNQIKINAENVRARKNPNGDILGYVNPGIYNSLEIVKKNNYDWHKIAEGLYCAMGEWATWLPKKEKPVEPPKQDETVTKIDELNNTINSLKKELSEKEKNIGDLTSKNTELTNTMISKDKEIETLKNELENSPELIFESPKSDYYAIKLNENEKLYLG